MLNKLLLADVLVPIQVEPSEELLNPGIGAVDVERLMVVEDINDNPPVFSSDHYDAEVEEERFPGLAVLTVAAQDADAGDNGQVQYRWREGGGLAGFDINPRTGEITTNIKLDREKQEQYELHVEAYDNGEKPLTGAAVIKVTSSPGS